MPEEMQTFSIEISPRNGGRYKSITTLSWNNIPGLAILTGRNGSGKTQLLEVLAYSLSGAIPYSPTNEPIPVTLHTIGMQYSPNEIGYIPSGGRFAGGGATSIANMPNARQEQVQLVQNQQNYRHDITQSIRASKVLKVLAGRSPHSLTPQELADLFSDDFDFMMSGSDPTEGLAHIFMAHRLKGLEAIERNTAGIDRHGKPIGPAPWDIVNDSLKVAGFPYEVVSPLETPILDTYYLRLKDTTTGQEINTIDLSSGEKVLLQLVLWLFTANKEGVFPKLLLLDEPDAHLHPSMTTQFIDVISEVLVKKHKVRVILTTHSPSTVALAPSDSVFQLSRGCAEITKVNSQADIISVLTAGLVTVSRATKFCFVEDENDVLFYETIYEIFTDYGPSQDPLALSQSPSIAFIPASVGAGRQKIPGGSTIVRKWVEKLDQPPLDKTFVGILDRDLANEPAERVYVIGRYSFENYLLDPLVLFALLVEEGVAPAIDGIQISSGDEHLLRTQTEGNLQIIADFVCSIIESADVTLSTPNRVIVEYSVGARVSVPQWVIDKRGHDLLPLTQRAFGKPNLITPPRLRKAMRRCRLIPKELPEMLLSMQQV